MFIVPVAPDAAPVLSQVVDKENLIEKTFYTFSTLVLLLLHNEIWCFDPKDHFVTNPKQMRISQFTFTLLLITL